MMINDSQIAIKEKLFEENFPRKLYSVEKYFLDWLLPKEISAYNSYQEKLGEYFALAEGRRGKGNLVLGKNENDVADVTSPLADVFAYGVIETSIGNIACTIREEVGEQIDIEIMNLNRDEVVPEFEEARRWSYSLWNVGNVCPQCLQTPRTISLSTNKFTRLGGQANELMNQLTLAICSTDKRLWIRDEETNIKRIIPVTNFYNELMFYKKIRDAKTAFDSKRLFTELNSFSDEDLIFAFLHYNKIHRKVDNVEIVPVVAKKISFVDKVKKIFT